MTQGSDLLVIRGGQSAIQRWRKANPRGRLNLKKLDLRREQLAGLDLAGADLSGSNLSGMNASGAILVGAILVRANLLGAILRSADLRRADLRSAVLDNAVLVRADLRGAKLTRASLRGALATEAFITPAARRLTVLKKGRTRPATSRSVTESSSRWKVTDAIGDQILGGGQHYRTPSFRNARDSGPTAGTVQERFRLGVGEGASPAPRRRRVSVESPSPGTKVPYSVVRVFYGTDRKVTGEATPAKHFNAKRGNLTFGTCDVSIPRDHKMGKLEGPSVLRLEFRADPKRHVHVLSLVPLAWREFRKQFDSQVAESNGREALVFIHGYNVSFVDAIRRTAQIAYDLGFDGVPVSYSWPAGTGLAAYDVDQNNVEATEPHLRTFLTRLLSSTELRRIHLVAHSMGNRALVKMLAQAASGTKRANGRPTISQVILAAPDIDADVMKNLAVRMKGRAKRVTLYASANDKALRASVALQGGYPRAGSGGETIFVAAGIDTVDATALNTDFIGHSYVGDKDSVLSDMYYLIRDGKPPGKRFGLLKRTRGKQTYWEFRRRG